MTGVRRRGPRAASSPDPLDLIRNTIATLDHQRRTATTAAGVALVNHAQIELALREQARRLARSRTQLQRALDSAEAAARTDSDTAAVDAYDATARGTRSALDVVAGALDQLTGLQDTARTNAGRARTMLATARAALDEALREQVRLLRDVDRARRAELVARRRAARTTPIARSGPAAGPDGPNA